MTAIPTLSTARLTLRPPEVVDFEAYADMVTSDRARWMKQGLTREDAWGWFANDVAHWHLFGHGGLMIEKDGKTIGQVSITRGADLPEPELGWMLYDGHEGHGYATEAAMGLRDHAFEAIGLKTLVSFVAAENTASVAVAERLGARPDPDAPWPWPTGPRPVIYRHPTPEVRQ